MAYWLSNPVEKLLSDNGFAIEDLDSKDPEAATLETEVDYLIVGSGYGAAMAALAICQHDLDAGGVKPVVWILERGDEYLPDDFPKTIDNLPAYLNFVGEGQNLVNNTNTRNHTGLWEIRAGKGISVLTGSGLGGTSLINANVAVRPDDALLETWPARPNNLSSWTTQLNQVYPKIEKLLGVQETPGADGLPKYEALANTANLMAGSPTAAAAAKVSINFDGTGDWSVDTGKCNFCGNCVIGCHSGAKQSLNLNAWPLVKQLGNDKVELLTGVTVSYLQEREEAGVAEERWLLACTLTRFPEAGFSIKAKHVILAAGTIGSTEILKRSNKKGLLPLADKKLGKKFSGNGDALISSVGQNSEVGATTDVPGKLVSIKQPGPTIVGKASLDLGDSANPNAKITLEDGAVPFPLLPLWQEMITTQSFFNRYAEDQLSAWHQNHPDHDYLAVSSDLNQHSQVLLVMGDDHAQGSLEYNPEKMDAVIPEYLHKDVTYKYFDKLHERMKAAESTPAGGCYDGGLYHPNLLWKPFPEGFGEAVEGTDKIDPMVMSVHPLGGCCIGSDGGTGVVNARGQVFKTNNNSDTYENLYVMDGAIVPGAIGTNPFMTIASAAYVLGHELAQKELVNGPALADDFPVLDKATYYLDPAPPNPIHPIPSDDEQKIEAVFKERLVNYLGRSSELPWSRKSDVRVQHLNQIFGDKFEIPDSAHAIVLDIEFEFTGDDHLGNWMENPDRPLKATATLSYDCYGSILTITNEHLIPIARLKGEVNLGIVDKPYHQDDRLLTIAARWLRYRWTELFGGLGGSVSGALLRIARLHSDFRHMDYRFESDPLDPVSNALQIKIRGTKKIGFTNEFFNLWGSLMTLDGRFESRGTGNWKSIDFDWEVDAVDITNGAIPLQLRGSLNLLTAMSKVGGAIAFFLRSVMQTHFWSFGAADYGKYRTMEDMDATGPVNPPLNPKLGRLYPPPQSMKFGSWKNQKSTIVEEVVYPGDDDETQTSRLIRYQPENSSSFPLAERKVLLLIHGLAHSSRIFWTETLAENGWFFTKYENCVQYFLNQNYDVWILDHRISSNYVKECDPDHKWDDIALTDVPWAVRHVFDAVNPGGAGGDKKLHIFAHCIGAGAAYIAALNGKFENPYQPGESMVASLVSNAIAPWLFASRANRARENVWAMFKNLKPVELVEPRPHKDTGLLENMFDRIATSALGPEENGQWNNFFNRFDERGPLFPRTIYSRYTITWGREWFNDNIRDITRNEFGGMIGSTPRAVLQQVYSSIVRGLLSDDAGNNSYVVKDNICDYLSFPTFFMHGEVSTVFDKETAKKSAEMLTRHRKYEHTPEHFWDEITPEDYCENNVWVDIVPEYGHMDMVLGETARKDVYPKIDRFMSAAESNSVYDTYKDEYTSASEKNEFRRRLRAGSHIGPIKRPLTGPIISNPNLITDEHGQPELEITIWVEAQDFSSIPVDSVVIDTELSANIVLLNAVLVEVPGKVKPNPDEPGFLLKRDLLEPLSYMDGGRKTLTRNEFEDVYWITQYRFRPDLVNPNHLMVPTPPTNSTPMSGAGILRYLWVDYGHASNIRPPTAVELDWEELDWLQRVLKPGDIPDTDPALSFVIGSCFYPGFPFDREQKNDIFKGIYSHVLRNIPDPTNNPENYRRGIDHMLLLGDQIYADATANVMDPIRGYEKFRDRYRSAWSNPPARKLLSHVPTYFAVDDHEFRNDFQGLKLGEDDEEFILAQNMALQFQIHDIDRWSSGDIELWNAFSSAGYPFFTFDTRMQRQGSSIQTRDLPGSLLGAQQLSDFEAWLIANKTPANGGEDNSKDVLFIGSGSGMPPITRAQELAPSLLTGDDSLLGYPGFLDRVAWLLSEHVKDKYVCWLSGDPHISFYSNIELAGVSGSARIMHICSSGLYSPISFINTNPKLCDWNVGRRNISLPVGTNALVLHYDQHFLSNSHQHFLRLDLHEPTVPNANPELTIGVYDAEGNELSISTKVALTKVG